ncbi:MAG: RDD family protein [Flavisolibacter sp.]
MNITETTAIETEQHLFTEQDQLAYTEASTGQRFLNFLVDALLMQYGLSIATGYILAKIVLAISPQTAYDLFVTRSNSAEVLLSFYLLSVVNYLIYYTICEKSFRGYTLGKLITGTRAVRADGTELRLKDAFLRSLSRLVPFEAFSIWFGEGLWHDRWTRTMVVKAR